MQGQSMKGVLFNYCMYTTGRKCVQCVGGEATLPGCLLLPGQSTVSVNTVSSVWSNLQCMSAET